MRNQYRGNDPYAATNQVKKITETIRRRQGVLDPQLDFDLAVLKVLVLNLELEQKRRQSLNPFSGLFKR